jgi:phosphate-selective porin OprO/OprP
VQFKFGQFKEPFSQEELVTAAYIDFVERSPVNNLVPAYSPGAQVWGQLLKGTVEYQLGAFNGKGFLNLNDQSTPEGLLRLRFYPWRNSSVSWLKGFGFGGAVADGRTSNGSSFSGLMPTRTFTFFKTETVNGKVIRANGELTWTLGPAALRAEYVQTNQNRQNLGRSGTNLPGVVAKAYYVSATYLLTREKRPENGQPKPGNMFLSEGGHGIGAWELKLRYSNIQMTDGLLENRADQISTGVNWYPNSFVRFMLDFNVERLKNPISSPTALAPQTFLSVLQRVQFRF